MKNYTKKIVNEYGSAIYHNSKKQKHRLDGPAVEFSDGTKYWYMNGSLHCLDGPAITYASKWEPAWYLCDLKFEKFEHNKIALFYTLEPQIINFSTMM
jgi:hypothetical protein